MVVYHFKPDWNSTTVAGLPEEWLRREKERVIEKTGNEDYLVPLVNGHRITRGSVKNYPPGEVVYVTRSDYQAGIRTPEKPIPPISEIIKNQPEKIKALAKSIAEQTAQQFVQDIIPESLSANLSEAQLNAQKQELSYNLAEMIKTQLDWELNQALLDAKKITSIFLKLDRLF